MFYDIVWLVISLKKTTSSQNSEKVCGTPKDLRCDFVFQYPIEFFLSIMWKPMIIVSCFSMCIDLVEAAQ